MSDDANDLLMSGGTKSASFAGTPPISWTGTILAPPVKQQKRDMKTNELKFWDDGNPQMQIVVKIQTDQRDPEVPDDDGSRGLYLDNGRKIGAVREAVKAAGARGLEPGGRITLTYTSDDHTAQVPRGFSLPKNFEAKYEPPNPFEQPANEDPWDTGAPQRPLAQTHATPGVPDPLRQFLISKGLQNVESMPDGTVKMIASSYPDAPK